MNFSAPKKGLFSDERLKGTYLSGMASKRRILMGIKKKNFDGLVCHFLEINNHSFVKSDLKFKNKCLLHAKFYGALQEKIFGSQICVH